MKSAVWLSAVLVTLVFAAGDARAQDDALVTLSSEVLKEVETVTEDGQREVRLVPVKRAMPGETLVFRILYTNEGAEPAEKVSLTNPVPEHVEYLSGTAGGEDADVTFSVDGGETFLKPESLFVTGEDGRPRKAEASDYTHIRWQLTKPVPRGGGGSVRFKARLE